MVAQSRNAKAWAAVQAVADDERAPISIRHVVIASVRALGATGAGLSLARGAGPREPVLATAPLFEDLEDLQFTVGVAPCSDAVAVGGPVLVPDLAGLEAGRRWPVFAPSAVERGMHGMFVFPVAAGAEGSLGGFFIPLAFLAY